MSLIERLRDTHECDFAGKVVKEAADRIEALERKLKESNEREAKDYAELQGMYQEVKELNIRLLTKIARLTDPNILFHAGNGLSLSCPRSTIDLFVTRAIESAMKGPTS